MKKLFVDNRLLPLIAGSSFFLLFLWYQAQGVWGGDSGDMVTAAATFGVAHPPGYPLYSLLGGLLNQLPILTPAWRVGFLSSLPHAITTGIIAWVTLRLTRSPWAAIFAALAAAGNYLFFMYSTTTEVFALLDMFLISLFALGLAWIEHPRKTLFLTGALIFGLASTHHHLIVFLLPALGWIWWQERKTKKLLTKRTYLISVGLFLLGFLPYGYVFIVGGGSSMVNWDRVTTVARFLRLVTRADYGTFLSGTSFGQLFSQRFLQIAAYGRSLVHHIGWVGIVLAVVGLLWLWKKNRRMFLYWVIALVILGPAFLFYASFPLINAFTLGTYERFLLPTYTLTFPLIGMGMFAASHAVRSFARRYLSDSAAKLLGSGVGIILLLYPLLFLRITLSRFAGLPADRTGDFLARDMFAGLPQQSILLVAQDTPQFTAEYVRYALGVRPDIAVLASALMTLPEYQESIRENFPDIWLPENPKLFRFADFIKQNSLKYSVFSNTHIPLGADWHDVPHGLVFRIVAKDDLPDVASVYADNQMLWKGFNNPARGILGTFDHLLLSEVRNVYARGRLELGQMLFRSGDFDLARPEFIRAIAYKGDTSMRDGYVYLGLNELFAKQCSAALDAFARARETGMPATSDLTLYESVTYGSCLEDKTKAKELMDEYERARGKEETPLAVPR